MLTTERSSRCARSTRSLPPRRGGKEWADESMSCYRSESSGWLRSASFIALDLKGATGPTFLSPLVKRGGKENWEQAGVAQRVRGPSQTAIEPSQRTAFNRILSGICCLKTGNVSCPGRK
jgi:hypothetical protein